MSSYVSKQISSDIWFATESQKCLEVSRLYKSVLNVNTVCVLFPFALKTVKLRSTFFVTCVKFSLLLVLLIKLLSQSK